MSPMSGLLANDESAQAKNELEKLLLQKAELIGKKPDEKVLEAIRRVSLKLPQKMQRKLTRKLTRKNTMLQLNLEKRLSGSNMELGEEKDEPWKGPPLRRMQCRIFEGDQDIELSSFKETPTISESLMSSKSGVEDDDSLSETLTEGEEKEDILDLTDIDEEEEINLSLSDAQSNNITPVGNHLRKQS
jgi:hypothetical protein